jgi:hypothetical protein
MFSSVASGAQYVKFTIPYPSSNILIILPICFSRCPICRCEIESNCSRYNQSNFEKLLGPLQSTTVQNHEDPSRLEPPRLAPSAGARASNFIDLTGSHPSRSSHMRMTIRMPYPTLQLLDRMETSRAMAEVVTLETEQTVRPPTRFSSHSPQALTVSTVSSSAKSDGSAGKGNKEMEDVSSSKRQCLGETKSARLGGEAAPAAALLPSSLTVPEWRATYEDAPAALSLSQARGRRVTNDDSSAVVAPDAPRWVRRSSSKRNRLSSPSKHGAAAVAQEAHHDDLVSPIAARTRMG